MNAYTKSQRMNGYCQHTKVAWNMCAWKWERESIVRNKQARVTKREGERKGNEETDSCQKRAWAAKASNHMLMHRNTPRLLAKSGKKILSNDIFYKQFPFPTKRVFVLLFFSGHYSTSDFHFTMQLLTNII